MTEYDRTPIEVAAMRWGDLIARDSWETHTVFVAVDPTSDEYIVALGSDGFTAGLHRSEGPWFKLTPKPEPTFCAHCGEKIERIGSNWVHDLDRLNCRPTYATPAPTETSNA